MTIEAHLNDAKDVLVTIDDVETFGLPKGKKDMETWLYSRIRACFDECDEKAVAAAVKDAK